MRLPFSVLMGSILAIIFATSSLMSFVILTVAPPSSAAAMISATAYLIAIAGVLVAATCAYLVLKGSERARMFYLVWTASAFVLNMSIAPDTLTALVEATLSVIVLFFWFLPSSSDYLVRLEGLEFAYG